MRHEKEKKKKNLVGNKKKKKRKKKLWKEWKGVEKMWKRVLKCCLLKEGSKTVNSALIVVESSLCV